MRTSLCMLDHVSELKANGDWGEGREKARGGEVQAVTGPAGREGGRGGGEGGEEHNSRRGRVREREKERVEHRTDDKL